MYFKISILYCFFLLFFFTNQNYNKSTHTIELYQYNSLSLYSIFSHFNILLESGLKNIYNLYDIISNIEENSSDLVQCIELLYQNLLLLKNENISIGKKIIKLFRLIKENIPNQKNQQKILKIYKKIFNIFL